MLKVLVIGVGVLLAGPAVAGCYNYAEGDAAKAPKATICLAGQCEETTLEVECSNADATMMAFHNGVSVAVNVTDGVVGDPVIKWKGREVRPSDITCTQAAGSDEDACYLLLGL